MRTTEKLKPLMVIKEIVAISTILVFIFIDTAAVGEQREEGEESLFTIQIGAFLNEQNALALKSKMIQKTFPAYIHESLDKEGIKIFRVRIGKFKTREEAEAFGKSFYEKEKLVYLVLVAEPAKIALPVITEEEKTKTTSVPPEKVESSKIDTKQNDKEPLEEPLLYEDDQIPVSLETVLEESPAGKEEVTKELERFEADELPQRISKIYTYRGDDSTIYMTNRFDEIPEKHRNRLERIFIYPVKFVSFNLNQKILYVRIGEKEQAIRLMGVDISSPSTLDLVNTYFEKNLKGLPLRFEYSPKSDGTGEMILVGDISNKQGKSINLDMIRQGIAPCSLEELPINRRKAFEDAERFAREKKIGIWTIPQNDE